MSYWMFTTSVFEFGMYDEKLTWEAISSLNMLMGGLNSSRCSCKRTDVGKCWAVEVVRLEETAGVACSRGVRTAKLKA